MDFTIINKAGIHKSEFAKIMRTSRTTVHSWMSGGGIHSMIRVRLARTLSLIGKAVDAGDLPLPHTVARADRVGRTMAAIKKHNASPSAD